MEMLLSHGPSGLATLYVLTAILYGRLYLRRESAARWLAPAALPVVVLGHAGYLAASAVGGTEALAATGAGSLSILALSVAAVYAVVEWSAWSRGTGFWMVGLAALFQAMAALLAGLGASAEPAAAPDALFTAHQVVTLAAFAACAVAAAYGFLYLNLEREERLGSFSLLFGNLPRLAALESMIRVALWCAFVGLAAALATGVRWGARHLPESWFLEPKILALFCGWLLYGLALLARRTGSWEGRRTALASLVGLVAILFSLTAFQIVATRFL